jgi:acetoacetyl-CoA synthetase
MLMPMPTDDQVTASERGGLGGSSPRASTERGGLGGSSPRASTDPADQAGLAAAPGGRDYGATLWEPSERSVRDARVTGYASWLAGSRGPDLTSYDELWRWSVGEPEAFWMSVWDYFGVIGRRGDGPVLSGGPMPDVTWFGGTTLNYARNALRTASTEPAKTAVIFRSEAGRSGTLSYSELAAEVARVRAGLHALGVTKGDRVAAYLPNVPEALIGLLATASLGAIWSACSPDFGPRSVIDRLAQISPKVLFAVDGYPYGGKWFDRRPQVADIVAEMPGLDAVIMVDYLAATGTGAASGSAAGDSAAADVGGSPVRELRWDALPTGDPATDPATAPAEFEEVPFDHPLWVLYSSGTTGLPKPIVHGHGGIVLEHLKSMALHQDLGPQDVFFWYTATGWMMWNYLVGGLLVGATVVLYDGSATHPGTDALWRLADEAGVTYLGAGAPYLLACMKVGLRPAADHDLTRLRGVGSTGSPLPPEGFRWVYDAVATEGKDLILGSYSGGTDLCTGFVGPCPLLPVRAGVISGRCLGASVEAYDAAGRPVTGEVGELVITRPMPSMPVGFWNDPGGRRYRESYFADYPGVWRHGDWIMILPDGGCVIYGRSDATLNRGGVRMGTSEFYRIVEALPQVADSLVIDTGRLGRKGRLILYVVPVAGHELDDELVGQIRSALRSGLSPRHVPDEIHRVPGIPRTLSGKKLEVPVRKILLGTPVADAADPDALANPEVLASFVPGAAR